MGEPTVQPTEPEIEQNSSLKDMVADGLDKVTAGLDKAFDAIIPDDFLFDVENNITDPIVHSLKNPSEAMGSFNALIREMASFLEGAETVGGNSDYTSQVIQAISPPSPPSGVGGVQIQLEQPTVNDAGAPKQMRQTPEQLQVTIKDLMP